MKSDYNPPFTITGKIVNLVADITEAVTRLTIHEKSLRLRRVNRIATIHGSLAIEGNTLSIEQITAILGNKPVIGSAREIQEVRNAIAAYDCFDIWNPCSFNDLLNAHLVLMRGLLDDAGQLRSKGVGVFAGSEVIHVASQASRIPVLIGNLLDWLKSTAEHPLIAAAVFHYEFEFIHPFSDGNGRMGRLWQTLILNKWNKLFANLPIESLIYKKQSDYYDAIRSSTKQADCFVFVEFILDAIYKAICEFKTTPEVAPEVAPEVMRLLRVLSEHQSLSRKQIQHILGLKDEKNMRLRYIKPALEAKLIEQAIPDKPTSRLQKYKITEKAIVYLKMNEVSKSEQ